MASATINIRIADLEEFRRFVEAVDALLDESWHREGCPAAEWSGMRPVCSCGWDDAVAEVREAWPA